METPKRSDVLTGLKIALLFMLMYCSHQAKASLWITDLKVQLDADQTPWVSWKIHHEEGDFYYELQKLSGQHTFKTLEEFEKESTMLFIDEDAENGQHFYRVARIHSSGKMDYSKPVHVTVEKFTTPKIMLMGEGSQKMGERIILDGFSGEIKVFLFDFNGQLLREGYAYDNEMLRPGQKEFRPNLPSGSGAFVIKAIDEKHRQVSKAIAANY